MAVTLTLTPTSQTVQGEAPNILQQTFVLTTDTRCTVDSIVVDDANITIEEGYGPGGANVPFTLDVSPDAKNIVLNIDTTNFGAEDVKITTSVTSGSTANSFDFKGYVSRSLSRSVSKKILSQDKV